MSDSDLTTVEVTTGEQPRLGIIWLHGLGADGHDEKVLEVEIPSGVQTT